MYKTHRLQQKPLRTNFEMGKINKIVSLWLMCCEALLYSCVSKMHVSYKYTDKAKYVILYESTPLNDINHYSIQTYHLHKIKL